MVSLLSIRDVLLETQTHVLGCMQEQMPLSCYFHHANHTLEVVRQCEELAKAIELPWHRTERLLLAAWFHDLGYMDGSIDHEKRGAALATTFLATFFADTHDLECIQNLIYSTRSGTEPKTLEEKILRDANTSYLASPQYLMWSQMLRQERQALEQNRFTDKEWYRQCIETFTSHRYFTPQARLFWNHAKGENLDRARLLAVRADILPQFSTNPFAYLSATDFSQN